MQKLPFDSIETAWKYFFDQTLLAAAPKIQISEMQKAFWAGASCCFDIMTTRAAELPEEEAMEYLNNLHKEFQGYIELCKKRAEEEMAKQESRRKRTNG
jgi:hypothetical protein